MIWAFISNNIFFNEFGIRLQAEVKINIFFSYALNVCEYFLPPIKQKCSCVIINFLAERNLTVYSVNNRISNMEIKKKYNRSLDILLHNYLKNANLFLMNSQVTRQNAFVSSTGLNQTGAFLILGRLSYLN